MRNTEGELMAYTQDHAGLAWLFRVDPDSCDNPEHYENYLRLIALTDAKEGRGRTHIFLANIDGQKKILAYVTLRASAIIRQCDGETYGEPAMEIAELAVCDGYEDRGFGTLMVKFAMAMAEQINERTASVKHVVLCADPAAVGFYLRAGFKHIDEHGEIPREGWNANCIPMYIQVPQN